MTVLTRWFVATVLVGALALTTLTAQVSAEPRTSVTHSKTAHCVRPHRTRVTPLCITQRHRSAPVIPERPSWLVACILWHETGSVWPNDMHSQEVAGQYMGVAMWDESAWVMNHGTRYSSTPLGATASEQLTILEQAVATPRIAYGEWEEWDGC